MNESSRLSLVRLEEADWFSNVGKPSDTVVVVHSWVEAMQLADSSKYENARLEVTNRMCEKLQRIDKDRFNKWNEIARWVRPLIDELVARKISDVVKQNDLPESFSAIVRWDIAHLFMESEYVDLLEPSLYSGLAYWYVSGRFPCGHTTYDDTGVPIIY